MPLWTHKNIKAWIFLNDHCDPHVTFDCRADHWTARIRFSMVKPDISLVDVKPKRNAPSVALLNLLANQLDQRLERCRMVWWQTKGGELCIDNKEVMRIGSGRVLLDGPFASGVIIAKSGNYLPGPHGNGYRVTVPSVRWTDGTVTNRELVE